MDVSEKSMRQQEKKKIAPSLPNATGDYSQAANFFIVINAL